MAARLENRLTQARRRRFVGRRAELELFLLALGQGLPDFAVLHLHGPGGMGKTTLLHEFGRLAAEAGRRHLLLDGRLLDASPAGFLVALQAALNLPADQDPLQALTAVPDLVLLIDTYELLMPLDSWLRTEFLPQLAEGCLVVIAGRQPPPAAWRSDDGWGELTRIVSLRNLRPEESEAYLRGQGVPEAEIGVVLQATHGHPLALSLAADLFGQNQAAGAFDLKQEPDIVRVLLERFVADVPDPVLRQALEVCAHALATDEALVADLTGYDRRGRAYGFYAMAADLGATIGPFGGAWLYQHVGPSAPFYANSLTLALCALLLALFLRLPARSAVRQAPAEPAG
jgi:hypothetical protein